MPMIDIREGAQHSLSPFFEAGKAEPFIFAYRDEGVKYTASGFVDDISSDISGPGNIVVQQGASGIQGFTKFQANIEMISLT